MKTFSLIIITLSFSLFGINAVAAGADENSQQRCNSLPFSLEGDPETGSDGKEGYKGKLIDGITHVFYPSGTLERRGKRGVDDTNAVIGGIGVWEYYSEDCYLIQTARWENGINVFMESYTNGNLTAKGPISEGNRNGLWNYYSNGVRNETVNWKNGVAVSGEFYTNGNLTSKGPYSEGNKNGLWSYYKNGDLYEKHNWKNGVAVFGEFYTNGNLTSKGPWSAEGKIDGLWSYYKNGTLYQEATYKNGKNIKQVQIYPSVTCGKLVSDFSANEMRALRDHKNKTYIITARVSSVGADFMDNAQITLSDGEQWSFNSCIASPAKGEEFYYDLNEGQLVEMQCTVEGEMMGSPMLEKCVLAN